MSQLQVAQPLLGLAWAQLLLGEPLDPAALLAATAVVLCVAQGLRAGQERAAWSGRRSVGDDERSGGGTPAVSG